MSNHKQKVQQNSLSFIKIFKLFFTRYTIYGILLILISILIDSYDRDNFLITIIKNLFSTIGTALIVGAVFDFSKNTEAFTEFVSDILKNIVVSKDFLNEMAEAEKKNSLELILKPTNLQIEQCSSIDLYYKKSIDNFMELYNKPFKTDLVLTLEILKRNGRLVAKGDMSHRIYKVNGKYPPIITTFEKEDCKICSSYIILPDGKKIPLKNEVKEKTNKSDNEPDNIEEKGIYRKYITEIPEQYSSYPYLTLYREVEEEGYDHWTNFHWTSLTPCDGIKFKLFCRDDITIKDYLIFDNKQYYDVVINDTKDILTIISTNWLDTYTGFTITASDTK